MRELAGTLMREGLRGSAGILATSADFTTAAAQEAATLGVELIDGRALIARLERVGADRLVHRAETLDTAHACPQCGRGMVIDHSRYGWWLHCPDYSKGCEGKRNLGIDPRRAVEQLVISA